MILFSNYFKLKLSLISVSEINFCFESSQFLDLVQDMDLPAVDLITFLITDSTGNLYGSNRSEDLA